MAVLGAVVAFSVYSVRRDGGSERPATPGPDARPGAAAEDGVGPQPGDDLVAYGEAVVSMRGYKTEAEARRIVADLPVVAPPAATTDPASWISDQKAADRSERDEIKKLIPTVDDPSRSSTPTRSPVSTGPSRPR